MATSIFAPADILIPADASPESLKKWSVIACDQFSSEPEYWERVRGIAAHSPSTLNMIIPEAYLAGCDEEKHIEMIGMAMNDYLSGGVFKELECSFILTERTLSDGKTRKGIIGAIDLEEYDFNGGSPAIRASEGTVLDRLPVRKKIRSAASLELPHIIVFIDDAGKTVIEPLAGKADSLPAVYDFDLMESGGHITGRQVAGRYADDVMKAMQALCAGIGESGNNMPLMVIGDGNHSLAGAKIYWDELKENLSGEQLAGHPARRALVEVCNVYDDSITFEAIHRVLFDIDTDKFIRELESSTVRGTDYTVRLISGNVKKDINIKAGCIGDMLESVQGFIDRYMEENGGGIDYIHGSAEAEKLAQKERALALLLPAMDKSELFRTVAGKGVFPRKSFSVGHAGDKRYYLECRRIKY